MSLDYSLYKDSIHLKPEVSYRLGKPLVDLFEILIRSSSLVKDDFFFRSGPYCLIESADAVNKNDLVYEDFNNSLMEFVFLVGHKSRDGFVFRSPGVGYAVVSLGYYNDIGKTHSFCLLSEMNEPVYYRVSGDKYFHESLNYPVDVGATFYFKEVSRELSCKEAPLMGRPVGNEDASFFNLVEVLLCNGEIHKRFLGRNKRFFSSNELSVKQLNDLGFSKLKDFCKKDQSVDRISKKNIKGDKSADVLRDVALYFERIGEVDTAYKIMKEAYCFRPTGSLIRSKLKLYEKLLDTNV